MVNAIKVIRVLPPEMTMQKTQPPLSLLSSWLPFFDGKITKEKNGLHLAKKKLICPYCGTKVQQGDANCPSCSKKL